MTDKYERQMKKGVLDMLVLRLLKSEAKYGYQIIQEIDRRFILQIRAQYPGNEEKIRKMSILRDGQVKMAHLAIVAGFSVNGVARLHTEILKNQELKDFYQMMPKKFNNKTNGITQRRFLMHGNYLLADWVTEKIGTKDWITDLSLMSKLKPLADDPQALEEFRQIKFKNKERLAAYIKEHNGVEVDPRSIFDVQVKRLHEYKRQLLNILHVYILLKVGSLRIMTICSKKNNYVCLKDP